MLNELTRDEAVVNGTERVVDGKDCVYYEGYWIRRYDISRNTFRDKRTLIDQMTKRVFHHTEPGINTPG
ncbi:MAG: hypothetical protein H6978_11550, partial [Gammaproteobacteria bacterium]|nr:hypothetical protein [Gammaproteobacteria bacterium]